MSGYGQNGKGEQMLNGILAMLLALADLAEAAAGRSRTVRSMVFFVLVPAESVMRDFLSDDEWGSLEPPRRSGDHHADLLRLAESFRAMASLLTFLVASLPEIGEARLPNMVLAAASCATRALHAAAPGSPAPDTS